VVQQYGSWGGAFATTGELALSCVAMASKEYYNTLSEGTGDSLGNWIPITVFTICLDTLVTNDVRIMYGNRRIK
jgi:hypothetical protein